MTLANSGDSATSTDTSTARTPSTAIASAAEDGPCSAGAPRVATATPQNSAVLVRVRQFTGVSLRSPKHPHPAAGRRVRSTYSAPTAVQNRTTVSERTASAGGPAPNRPAVTSRPTPSPSSLTHTTIAAGRRSRTGNSAVGPISRAIERVQTARRALAAQPPRSRTASNGTWTSLAMPSTAITSAFIFGSSGLSHNQPAVLNVALNQPSSRFPPSSTKAVMVKSAIRPRGEVSHATQRSQNSRAAAPQLVTGSVAESSVHSLRISTALPIDRYGSRTHPGPAVCGSTTYGSSVPASACPQLV